MKRLLILLPLFTGLAASAQSTNAPTAKTPMTNAAPLRATQTLQAKTTERFESTITLGQLKPNEIMSGKFTFSGIAVEAVKKRNPLQLINPLAPLEYGSAEDNVVRDPINGRVEGLKIFAFRF